MNEKEKARQEVAEARALLEKAEARLKSVEEDIIYVPDNVKIERYDGEPKGIQFNDQQQVLCVIGDIYCVGVTIKESTYDPNALRLVKVNPSELKNGRIYYHLIDSPKIDKNSIDKLYCYGVHLNDVLWYIDAINQVSKIETHSCLCLYEVREV